MDDQLTAKEFDCWLTPDAINKIIGEHLPWTTWRHLLLKRIADDDAHAAARKVIYRRGSREESPHHLMRLPKDYWPSRPLHPQDDFWQTGDLVFTIKGQSYSSTDTYASCVDVRFDPEGIARMIPAPSRWKLVPIDAPIAPYIAPTPQRPNSVPVSDTEVRGWFEGLTAAQMALGVRQLWQLAKLAHPTRSLPRKLVEPLGKGRSTGPRPRE